MPLLTSAKGLALLAVMLVEVFKWWMIAASTCHFAPCFAPA
jgi:hypothetical protein